MEDNRKGVFVDDAIYALKELNIVEKNLLALYRFRTDGPLKCCNQSNEDIAEYFGVSEHTIQRSRKHLKELGYIKGNGVKVFCVWGSKSSQNGTLNSSQNGTPKSSQNGTPIPAKGSQNGTLRVAKMAPIKNMNEAGGPLPPAERNVKERASQSQPFEVAGPACPSSKNNFDTILAMIPGMTPDKETFLRNNIPGYIDKINSISCFDKTVRNDYLKRIDTYLKTNYDNPFS